MTLEALLRAAHDAGTIDTLSIFGPRKGAEKRRYQANLKRVGESAWRVEHSEDPVEALRLVLGGERTPAVESQDEDIFG